MMTETTLSTSSSSTHNPELTYTNEQIEAWLQGLLAIAWSDGDFDPQEQELIAELTMEQMAHGNKNFCSLDPVTPEEIAQLLGKNTPAADNFMRTAVMVAIADGVYTHSEAQILHQFANALGLDLEVLHSLEHTIYQKTDQLRTEINHPESHPNGDVLAPVRGWLDGLEMHDPRVARFMCKLIPAQCPFERDVTLFGRKIVHIPPMCKINPLYEQLVGLRFRALSYLADDCHEDITALIQ
jgi:tellurite resistance protein